MLPPVCRERCARRCRHSRQLKQSPGCQSLSHLVVKVKTSQSRSGNITKSKHHQTKLKLYHNVIMKTSQSSTEDITNSRSPRWCFQKDNLWHAWSFMCKKSTKARKMLTMRNQIKSLSIMYRALSFINATLHKKQTIKQKKWLTSVNCQMLKCSP